MSDNKPVHIMIFLFGWQHYVNSKRKLCHRLYTIKGTHNLLQNKGANFTVLITSNPLLSKFHLVHSSIPPFVSQQNVIKKLCTKFKLII